MTTGPGTVLGGRYRLDERIAGGGMGDVWKADDEVLGRTVAVKILLPALLDEQGFAERFRGEARTMATISHPGVVNIYDYGSDQTVAYLVMEYVHGDPLSRILSQVGRLTAGRTMALAAQAAEALQAAHDRGIVHRDVKPGNLLVRPNGTLVLVDFGIARSALVGQLTAAGSVLGTASYISPEQAQGAVATPLSDIYALGVVAYQCLAGRRPFEGGNPVEIAMRHVREQPPRLPEDVPPQVRAIVERAMDKDPARRYPTATTFAVVARQASRALTGAQGGRPGRPPTASGAAAAARPARPGGPGQAGPPGGPGQAGAPGGPGQAGPPGGHVRPGQSAPAGPARPAAAAGGAQPAPAGGPVRPSQPPAASPPGAAPPARPASTRVMSPPAGQPPRPGVAGHYPRGSASVPPARVPNQPSHGAVPPLPVGPGTATARPPAARRRGTMLVWLLVALVVLLLCLGGRYLARIGAASAAGRTGTGQAGHSVAPVAVGGSPDLVALPCGRLRQERFAKVYAELTGRGFEVRRRSMTGGKAGDVLDIEPCQARPGTLITVLVATGKDGGPGTKAGCGGDISQPFCATPGGRA